MSQHIKSLFSQLANYNNNNVNTPTPKSLVKLFTSRKHELNSVETPKNQIQSFKQPDTTAPMTDSGLETSSFLVKTKTVPAKSIQKSTCLFKCKCKNCLKRSKRSFELIKKLKLASSASKPENYANIPILIVKSFRPQDPRETQQIEVKKGSAVNALFICEADAKWVYVKTSSEQMGFIPRKCCEPFVPKHCLAKSTNNPKSSGKVNTKPVKINKDHTYMTITDSDLNLIQTSAKCPKVDTFIDNDEFSFNQTDLSLFSVSKILQFETANDSPINTYYNLNTSCSNSLCNSISSMSSASESCALKENYEFLNVLTSCNNKVVKKTRSISKRSNEYIDLRETTNKIKTNKSKQQACCYDTLANFESLKTAKENDYDFLIESTSSARSKPAIRSLYRGAKSSSDDSHYDILMTYKSTKSKSKAADIYVNNNNNNNDSTPKVSLYKVVEEYTADFKGDLSVHIGDLVYLVDTVTSSNQKDKINNDWVCVRLYKRTRRCATANEKVANKNIYENVNELNSHLLQGYIPRAHLVKV